MKRHVLSFFLPIILFTLGFSVLASAEETVTIYINGEYLDCPSPAFIENGRTMVPARSIFEKLGATVLWNGEENSVTAKKAGTTVKMYIGNSTIYINGKSEVLEVFPIVKNGTTYVPARAVSAAFGANVLWNSEKHIVNITTDGIKTMEDFPTVLFPSDADDDRITYIGKDSVKIDYVFSEGENETLAYGFTEMFSRYEQSMCDIGWQKNIPEGSLMLLESVFYDNRKSDCPYEVRVFVNKPSVGRYEIYISVCEYIVVYNLKNGEIRRITESDYLMNSEYRDADTWKRSLGKTITVYDNYNNPTVINDYEIYEYLAMGMTAEPVTVVMYTPDNMEITVGVHQVDVCLALGFSLEPGITMYSPDGECEFVGKSEIYAKVVDGWSTEPFTVMLYSHMGKSIKVYAHEKDEYLAEGWYEELLVAMYSANGDKIYVTESQKALYASCGWSETPVISPDAEAEGTLTDSTVVYITPNGTKYHKSPKCAGSGAITVTYGEVKNIYQPCKTCTDE